MATTITDSQGLADLARHLLDTKRARPACLVTIAVNAQEPAFDLEQLASNAGQFCDFYVIQTGDLTRELQRLLPDNLHVYGGGARVYPTTFGLDPLGNVGKLRYGSDAKATTKVAEALENDIWGFANAAGLLNKPTKSSQPISGKIAAVMNDHLAIARLGKDGEHMVAIRQETSFPGVPLEWIFKKGQTVTGQYDPSTRNFVLDQATYDLEKLVRDYKFDSVTLALVKSTDRVSAVVNIHPNLDITMAKEEITGNPIDVVSRSLDIGDVIAVRIYRNPQGKTRLRMIDIDDDEVVLPALSLLPGGEPWLSEDRPLYETEEIEEQPLTQITETLNPFDSDTGLITLPTTAEQLGVPLPGPGRLPGMQTAPMAKSLQARQLEQTSIAGYQERLRLQELRYRQLNDDALLISSERANALRELARLRTENGDLRKERSEARSGNRSKQRVSSTTYSRRNRFACDQEWFREEVRRVWISKYTPADRLQYPLTEENWIFGERFFGCLNERELDEGEIRKLVRCVLDLVTTRNKLDDKREQHPLMANGRPYVREDKAAGMRIYVESGVAGAKRLHYFKLPDGAGYELSQVAHHDNYTP